MRALAAIAMMTVMLVGGAASHAGADERGPRAPKPALPTTKLEVAPDVTVLQGQASPVEIDRLIRKFSARFKRCYAAGLAASPGLKGRIDVQFSISARGVVLEAGIRSTTMHDEKVEACVVRVMRGLRFPRTRGVVAVSYPFVFGSP